jgi:glutathione peroxidase-family protein
MALIKNIIDEHGYISSYHTILDVDINKMKKCLVFSVFSYPSKEERDNQHASPVSKKSYIISDELFEKINFKGDIFLQLYSYLKTNCFEWIDATDI